MKVRKIKKELVEKEVLILHCKKNMGSSISTSETSENVFLVVFISSFVIFEVCNCFEIQASNGK